MFKKILETVEVYRNLLCPKTLDTQRFETSGGGRFRLLRGLDAKRRSLLCKEKINHKFSLTYLPTNILTCKRCAFTLAEVLITLGIIGVVAALTLPTLIQNHQKQTYVTGLKKAYSTLSNAMQNIANEEGVTEWKDISFVSNTYLPYPDLNVGSYFIKVDKFTEALTKHIKTIKKDFTYDKSASYNSTFDFISADGTTWFFDCALYISVDVNGQKGPNEYGRDIFVFEINVDRNRIEPNGAKTYKDFTTGKWVVDDYWKNCSAVSIGMHCTAKVLIEGKMNY